MVNKDLLKEIKFIVVRAFFLDIVLVAAASLFVSFVQALTGAVLGTILLAADMFLLSLSVQSVAKGVRRGKNGTAKMIAHYLLRIMFLAAGLYAALKLSFVNIICTAIPLFYPKVIYPAKAIFSKKEG